MTERLDHLDPATIAALVDRTLDPTARAEAEAHLAECADCREVWVETSEMVAAERDDAAAAPMSSAPAPVIAHRPRSRRWIYAGAGLAAAAAVVLALMSPRLFGPGESAGIEALVRAAGSTRRTESRVAGGFAWGDRPSPTRNMSADQAPASVRVAAANIEQMLASQRTLKNLVAAGTARLVTDEPEAAIAAFEEAATLDPGSVDAWTGLSAGHLELHRLRPTPDSAETARTAALRALALNEANVEARFNYALALERLARNDEAVEAWRRYLDVERDAGWRAEAESRIRLLSGRQ